MKIDKILLKKIDIPFKTTFRHASAERSQALGAWVEAYSEDGTVGYGESCPRDYVTGENLGTVKAFYLKHKASLARHITDLPSLIEWSEAHKLDIDRNPAAWCALEMAMIDLIAKENGESVESLLSIPELSGAFRYTAVLGDNEPNVFGSQFEGYRKLGFSRFKVKVSGNLDRDIQNTGLLHDESLEARIDANNLWEDPEQAIRYIERLGCPVVAVEEPLKPGRYGDLASIAAALKIKIILDESFVGLDQLPFLLKNPEIWIINVRVSKMGGVLRSLGVVEEARGAGIGVIIGAHVGETSLLARAALTVAGAARDVLVAQEGAYSIYLLEKDTCVPPVVFTTGGILRAGDFLQPHPVGFGLDVTIPDEFPFHHL